jgi:hypothetical protein
MLSILGSRLHSHFAGARPAAPRAADCTPVHSPDGAPATEKPGEHDAGLNGAVPWQDEPDRRGAESADSTERCVVKSRWRRRLPADAFDRSRAFFRGDPARLTCTRRTSRLATVLQAAPMRKPPVRILCLSLLTGTVACGSSPVEEPAPSRLLRESIIEALDYWSAEGGA